MNVFRGCNVTVLEATTQKLKRHEKDLDRKSKVCAENDLQLSLTCICTEQGTQRATDTEEGAHSRHSLDPIQH